MRLKPQRDPTSRVLDGHEKTTIKCKTASISKDVEKWAPSSIAAGDGNSAATIEKLGGSLVSQT